jgi:hypothetical protein
MTNLQYKTAERLFVELNTEEFHHGCCKGADIEAHLIVRVKCPNAKIFVHPPDKSEWKGTPEPDMVTTMLPPKPYLARARDIVMAVEILVAAPRSRSNSI